MARQPRLNVPGGVYHVLARGNRRATIFHDDWDYRAYLERLERYRQRDGVAVHAYVLMSNHVHLLLRGRNWGSDLVLCIAGLYEESRWHCWMKKWRGLSMTRRCNHGISLKAFWGRCETGRVPGE